MAQPTPELRPVESSSPEGTGSGLVYLATFTTTNNGGWAIIGESTIEQRAFIRDTILANTTLEPTEAGSQRMKEGATGATGRSLLAGPGATGNQRRSS